MLAHLAGLALRGRTVVASSHDLNLAARHGERILMIDQGRLIADGSAGDVLTAERLSEVYRCAVRVTAHPDDGRPVVYL